MCTSVVWADNGQAVLSSRNMDWFESMDAQLWVIPAGRVVNGAGLGDPNPLKWTSKFGSVVTSVYGIGTADGLNEKGLGAHLLWLTPSEYGAREDDKLGLVVSLWAQYYLDNFETVADAVADFEAHPYQVISADIAGREATVHLQISDATGDVGVFESIDGQIVIHHGKEYPVITNKPTFDEQLANAKRYTGLGGDLPLPGTTAAKDRFVRAEYYRQQLTQPSTTQQAIAELISVLRNAAQPYGAASADQPMIAPTIWRTTLDHSNLGYFFESTSRPCFVWLDLTKLDFSPSASVKTLTLPAMSGRIGVQNDALVEAELFEFSEPPESHPTINPA